jgi:hypothetical protein
MSKRSERRHILCAKGSSPDNDSWGLGSDATFYAPYKRPKPEVRVEVKITINEK